MTRSSKGLLEVPNRQKIETAKVGQPRGLYRRPVRPLWSPTLTARSVLPVFIVAQSGHKWQSRGRVAQTVVLGYPTRVTPRSFFWRLTQQGGDAPEDCAAVPAWPSPVGQWIDVPIGL